MASNPRPDRWTVVPHRGLVLVHLDEVPALLEWEPLLDEVRHYAASARMIVLDGHGWVDPYGQAMEKALRQTLEAAGVRVTRSAASLWGI